MAGSIYAKDWKPSFITISDRNEDIRVLDIAWTQADNNNTGQHTVLEFHKEHLPMLKRAIKEYEKHHGPIDSTD